MSNESINDFAKAYQVSGILASYLSHSRKECLMEAQTPASLRWTYWKRKQRVSEFANKIKREVTVSHRVQYDQDVLVLQAFSYKRAANWRGLLLPVLCSSLRTPGPGGSTLAEWCCCCCVGTSGRSGFILNSPSPMV